MVEQLDRVYVWVWLPGAEEPVPAGMAYQDGPVVSFAYGRRYLERTDAIPLFLPDLPLGTDSIRPENGLEIAGVLRDAGPDSWGQRVIANRVLARGADVSALSDLTYLVESGSNRIGGLDVQRSPTTYVAQPDHAPLEDLLRVADLVAAGEDVDPRLLGATFAGSSAGGARPKALVRDGGRELLAKFEMLTDPWPIVRGEFVAMRLAALCGLDVAAVTLAEVDRRAILLVERFDRRPESRERKIVVSALTTLGLDERGARYASYGDLAEIMRHRFTTPAQARRELFARLTFNVLVGNTDDHARNHAATWDGRMLTLTPAYDICPYLRAGGEATQAMTIGAGSDTYRMANVRGCIERAALFGLTSADAHEIVDHQRSTIEREFDAVADEAGLASVDRRALRNVMPHWYAVAEL